MRDAAIAAKTASEQLLLISKTTADRISSFSDQVENSVTETKNILQTLQQVWSEQSKQLENADEELAGAFGTITSNLGASLAQLEEFNKGMDDNMGKAVEGLSAIVDELSDSIAGIPR
jgi:ABC-type transporter Mla subunit MlaD